MSNSLVRQIKPPLICTAAILLIWQLLCSGT
ncbi:MAG: nitrate ABC transporter, permease protein, partial [Synechococcaceae bacterium WB6_3B_236]|nr:nitrate ABC transporter, permease protein [Synechococcaceae bacterium WB6_3B_236]